MRINGKTIPLITENTRNRYYDAGMSDLSFKSVSELQALLGDQLRALRQSKDLDQITTAEKAGISEKALRNLEAGRGSTVESFLRVLKALDSLDGLELRWAGIAGSQAVGKPFGLASQLASKTAGAPIFRITA